MKTKSPRGHGVLLLLMAGVLSSTMPRSLASQTSVTMLSGLSFGDIVSGTTTSVGVTSASALSFRIRANVGLSLGFSLTLPTTLARVGGGASLPVTFCSTCARYRVNNSNPAGGATFNPQNGVLGLLLLVASDVYVWVGASTSPPLNQPAGTYTGTVVITLAAII